MIAAVEHIAAWERLLVSAAQPARRNSMVRLLFALPLVAMLGCSASYKIQKAGGNTESSRLDPSRKVFVAVPNDGAYGKTTYAGSGQTTAQAVAAAFSKYAAQVQVAEKPADSKDAIAAARLSGATYLVIPVIAQWEHRATEWSSRPSRMAVRVTIVDVASGEQITSSSVEGRSRIVSLTSTSPESLLRAPLGQYVQTLY